MKILYLNAVCGVGSTGRIVVDLMQQAKQKGHTVKVACSTIEPIKGVEPEEVIIVGSKIEYYIHNALSKITDHEGLYSRITTRKLIKQIKKFDPDIIHVHNLHGHWINYEIFFNYLSHENKRVIMTLHDCWTFTGHCSHFSAIGCDQWKTGCLRCPGLHIYPKCYGRGDVLKNFERKKKAFTSLKTMTIVTPSQWLANLVQQSFLNIYPVEVIHNKIDLSVFKPTESDFRKKHNIIEKIIVLGVANVWNKEKGFDDFIKLRNNLDERYIMVMVGLTEDQIVTLPTGIIGICRTNSVVELAEIYSTSDVFINLTYQDNYPTVNLEAIACGTPVISYKTGGSCEAFDETSGIAVKQGDVKAVAESIRYIIEFDRSLILKRRTEFLDYGNYWPLYNR